MTDGPRRQRRAPARIPPLRLVALVAGTLFVTIGTILMALHHRWWGVAVGISGLLIVAGAWVADLRPPAPTTPRAGPVARASRPARRWWWASILSCALLMMAGGIMGLVIGNLNLSFMAAVVLIGYGLLFTGPLYADRWRGVTS